MTDKKPGVGVGVLLLNADGKVLMGRRHDDAEKADSELHGEGTWTLPGGKLDFREGLEECAKRELEEETGIKTGRLELISVANDMVPDNHFVTIGFLCRDFHGKPEVREPDEITEWGWFSPECLPERVFPPSRKMIENHKAGRIFSG